jgi:hypothetical protein
MFLVYIIKIMIKNQALWGLIYNFGGIFELYYIYIYIWPCKLALPNMLIKMNMTISIKRNIINFNHMTLIDLLANSCSNWLVFLILKSSFDWCLFWHVQSSQRHKKNTICCSETKEQLPLLKGMEGCSFTSI